MPPILQAPIEAGLQADDFSVIGDIDAGPAIAQHRQHRIRHRLAGQAGAGGADGDGRAEALALGEQRGDLGLGLDHGDQLRGQPVETGIGAIGEPAQGVADQPGRGDMGRERLGERVMRGQGGKIDIGGGARHGSFLQCKGSCRFCRLVPGVFDRKL